MKKDELSSEVDAPKVPPVFAMKRFSSLAGLFIVLFLFEHLLTNSQAALFFGDYGKGFIDSVNFIYSLPYLPVIEFLFLGVPIGYHGYWGIVYLYTSKPNSLPSSGQRPALQKYPRNQAYTWQRITAVILIVGIALHVLFMRFLEHPHEITSENQQEFFVRVSKDQGLSTLKDRLDLTLYGSKELVFLQKTLMLDIEKLSKKQPENIVEQRKIDEEIKQKNSQLQLIEKKKVSQDEYLVGSKNYGTATLLVVRDAFKSVWLCILYSLFVIAACFHGMNGVATFSISWGFTITERSRILVYRISHALMYLLIFLGLVSIWGSYWYNLRY